MQDHVWDDLRYVLSLYRNGTFSAAGRAMGTSETTIARRIRTLEQALGVKLFARNRSGRVDATEFGLAVIDRAERIESENIAINEAVGQFVNTLSGVVRISSVPIIVNRILIPALSRLRRFHPGLTVELVADGRNLDLNKREADLAVRFARPAHGGLETKAQKIGEMNFDVYGPAGVSKGDMGRLNWVGYDSAHASLPQARWLKSVMGQAKPSLGRLCVSDAETAPESVASGLGKSLLPRIVAKADPRLRLVRPIRGSQPPTRDVWLLSHADQGARRSVAAAKNWISRVVWFRDG